VVASRWRAWALRCSGRVASKKEFQGQLSLNQCNLSAKSSAASTDLLSRALRCRRAARVVKPRLFAVFRNNPNNFDAGSTDSYASPVDCEFCVFLPKLPAQSERAAACQTPIFYLQTRDNITTHIYKYYTMLKFPCDSSFQHFCSARLCCVVPC
jgi:hypothetical protein